MGDRRRCVRRWLGLVSFLCGLAVSLPLNAQPVSDSATVVSADETWLVDHSPRGALWRAAAVPGWGQIYNRQYLKLPIVYLGLGGFVTLALVMNDRYLLFRHAYLYTVDPVTFARYESAAQQLQNYVDAGRSDLLRTRRDEFRRNRDLSYLGIGLFYALTVLDAYVSAHLLDFDIGEDLTVRLVPVPSATGWAAALRVRL